MANGWTANQYRVFRVLLGRICSYTLRSSCLGRASSSRIQACCQIRPKARFSESSPTFSHSSRRRNFSWAWLSPAAPRRSPSRVDITTSSLLFSCGTCWHVCSAAIRSSRIRRCPTSGGCCSRTSWCRRCRADRCRKPQLRTRPALGAAQASLRCGLDRPRARLHLQRLHQAAEPILGERRRDRRRARESAGAGLFPSRLVSGVARRGAALAHLERHGGRAAICAARAFRRLRPILWSAMFVVQLGFLCLLNFADLTIAMLLFHLVTFDPSWIPPKHPDAQETIFYDGTCGLCHRVVRFVLAEDRIGTFVFSPLQGEALKKAVDERVRVGLPDSFVVVDRSGRLLLRSDAVVHMAARLGGLRRVLGAMLAVVPRPMRDGGYRLVGAIRHALFAKPSQHCPIVPPHLRVRFRE